METDPSQIHDQPWLIAHRGAKDRAPENTRPAFDAALDHPIDGIECDIQMSADGKLVIYHNTTLYRILRKRRPVAAYTWEELSAMDFGKWKSSEFAGTPVPTLEEVLADYSDRTRLMLEIKSKKPEQTSGRWEKLTDEVSSILKQYMPQAGRERLFVLSFDAKVLDRMKKNLPEMPCVLNLPKGTVKDPKALFVSPGGMAEGMFAVCIKDRFLTAELVHCAHNEGKRVFTYVCNTPKQVNRALVLGVDAIMTDRPGWLTRFLGASE